MQINLTQLYDLALYPSDKGYIHNYINGYYNDEFTPKQNDNIQLLEIGVQSGASLDLWSHFFDNGTIWGIDIGAPYDIKNKKNDIIVKVGDAYSINNVRLFPDNHFDYIIDDGPHTLESQLLAIDYYYSKLKENGKLIIEDIVSDDNLNALVDRCISKEYNYRVFDLRLDKNRFDDIILEITKQ